MKKVRFISDVNAAPHRRRSPAPSSPCLFSISSQLLTLLTPVSSEFQPTSLRASIPHLDSAFSNNSPRYVSPPNLAVHL